MAWLLAIAVLAWARASRTPWPALGFVPLSRPAFAIAAALLAGALFKIAMKAIVMPLLGAPAVNPAYHYVAGNAFATAGVLLFALASGAFGEEVVFRGFVFERVHAYAGGSRGATAVAVALSTALFAAAHYADQGWPGVEQAAFTGLAFGLVFARGGNLWTVMLVHAGFDLAAIVMIYENWEEPVARLFR
jgi:membrane protease YdiL (CAAX protease family)